MIGATLLLLAAAPEAANAQLACTVAMPGSAPAVINLDTRTKKLGVVAVNANGGPLARISSASALTPWPAGGERAAAFTAATGNTQYRIELQFSGEQSAGAARVRVVTLGGDGLMPLVGQGFCTTREGKRLSEKNLAKASFDATPAPVRPVKLQPTTPSLPGGNCRVVGPDRAVHRVDYTVLSAAQNETAVAYRFDNASFAGTQGGNATGVLFNLYTPQERLFALTVSLGGEPPLYVHQTVERSGIWIDLHRDSAVLGVGECGATAPALLATPVEPAAAPPTATPATGTPTP